MAGQIVLINMEQNGSTKAVKNLNRGTHASVCTLILPLASGVAQLNFTFLINRLELLTIPTSKGY